MGTETLLLIAITIIIVIPIVYTAFFFWFSNKNLEKLDDMLEKLNDVQMVILQTSANRAGLEDIIEDLGHNQDYVVRETTKQMAEQGTKIERLTLQTDSLTASIRILSGAVGSREER